MKFNLFIKTATGSFNIWGISKSNLELVLKYFREGKSDFMLNGTKYWLKGVREFKIFTHEQKESPSNFYDRCVFNGVTERNLNRTRYVLPVFLGQVGKDVTEHYLGNSEYGELEAQASHLLNPNSKIQPNEIKKYLNTEYVNSKVSIMNESVYKDSDIALGTAKELLETTCKSIIKQKGKDINKDWTLPQLLKATTAILDFKPKQVDNPENAEQSIKQILGGISSIVQATTELRNSYGTGHGKDAHFKGLETKYAKLLVGVVSEIVILYLSTNGETAELVES